MVHKHRLPLADQLFFSGAVGASLSHEINNVLAIIGELSGLIEDLSLADGGIDPAKLTQTLNRIEAQVERGKGHTRQLNTFSHSVEVAGARFDAAAAAEEVVALCERVARLKKVAIEYRSADEPAMLEGDLFDLEHVLFRQLQLAILGSAEGGTVRVGTRSKGDGVEFTCDVDSHNVLDETSQVEEVLRTVVKSLGGTFDVEQLATGSAQLHIRLPNQLNRLREI